MSKEIFEVNRVYGEEDFKTLMKKLITLKLNLQETSIKILNEDHLSYTNNISPPLKKT